MSVGTELLREHQYEELWRRSCGFIDLSLQEFMGIQRHLLLEQMELLNNCELGRQVMRGARPRTLEEFRPQVPLTTYGDYAPYLLEGREEVLPASTRASGFPSASERTAPWARLSSPSWFLPPVAAEATSTLASGRRSCMHWPRLPTPPAAGVAWPKRSFP